MLPADIRVSGVSPRVSLAQVLLALAALGGLVFAQGESLVAMVGMWSRNPMYSYAFAVPFISAYLLWSQRSRFFTLRPRGSWVLGAPILVTGFAMFLAGAAGGVLVLQQLAFLVNLIGVVVVLLGSAYVQTGWAAFGYLFLMIPVWDGLTESLHQPFQVQSAAIGVAILHWLGIPAYRQDMLISLPNIQIEVARACSGVNYLVAVVAVGLPLAYLSLRSTRRRIVLVGAAVLIAALSNGLRVALICALTYYEVGTPLHGPFHVLHGLFVAGIGYVALFAGLHLLARGERPGLDRPRTTAVARFPTLRPVASILVAAMFWTLGFLANREVGAVALDSSLQDLPVRFDGWRGEELPGRPQIPSRWWSRADEQFRRVYADGAGLSVEVSVWYFRAQREHHEVAGSVTTELHQGASKVTVPLGNGDSLEANLIQMGQDRSPALFWYEIDGAVETNRYAAVLRTTWNGFVHRRSNGAVVMLSAIGPAASDRDSLARLRALAAQAVQGVGRCSARSRQA